MIGLLRRWWLHGLLALLAATLLGTLLHGRGGEAELAALQARVERQEAENAELRHRNAAFAAELQDLKTGEAAVEERARGELGMIRPGETFYRVVEDPTGASPEQTASATPGTDTEPPP